MASSPSPPPPTGSTTRRITGSFGIEIRNADARALGGADLHALLEEHLVVVVRDQHLDRTEQVRLARSLGEVTPAHPVVPGSAEHPEILELDAARGGKNARWHTDVTFTETPPAISVLVAEVVPDTGGDTLWADQRAAYEQLAAPLQHLVADLEAVHRISPLAYWGEPFDTALTRDDAWELYEQSAKVPPVVHPLVRVHPVTGQPSLYVNPGFTSHIVGWSRIESDGLLQLLFAHATQPAFLLRHRWEAGDLVLWDNRATMHYAIDDFGDFPRAVRRVTIRGDRPVGPSGVRSRVVDDPLVAIR